MKIENCKLKIKQKKGLNQGSALITLIFLMVIATIVTTAAVSVLIINSETSGKVQQSTVAETIAESGAENGVLRMLRNPQYAGESLPVGLGTALITVTGTNPYIISSTGTYLNFKRTTQVNVSYDSDNRLIVSSWSQAF